MTEAVQIALMAAAPPTVAALCGLVLGIVNHQQGKEIHVLVNSKMTAVLEELKAAHARNAILEAEAESGKDQ